MRFWFRFTIILEYSSSLVIFATITIKWMYLCILMRPVCLSYCLVLNVCILLSRLNWSQIWPATHNVVDGWLWNICNTWCNICWTWWTDIPNMSWWHCIILWLLLGNLWIPNLDSGSSLRRCVVCQWSALNLTNQYWHPSLVTSCLYAPLTNIL